MTNDEIGESRRLSSFVIRDPSFPPLGDGGAGDPADVGEGGEGGDEADPHKNVLDGVAWAAAAEEGLGAFVSAGAEPDEEEISRDDRDDAGKKVGPERDGGEAVAEI